MPQFVPLEEMERAHAAYNECTENLANALSEVKEDGAKRSHAQLQKISELNDLCEELMRQYLKAFKSYYGEEKASNG
jgi:hypothetical protein